MAWGILTLLRADTTVLPHKRAGRLVTHGAFGFRRNPIYMGEVLIFLGLAQVTGNIWLAIVAPLFALSCWCLPSCPRSGIWRPASARSILPTRSARGAGSEGPSRHGSRRGGGGAGVPGGPRGPHGPRPRGVDGGDHGRALRRQERDHRLAARPGHPLRPRLLARAHPFQRRPADLSARRRPRPRPRPSRNRPSPKPAPAPRAPSQRETADLDALLAAGKGYRPLYQLLEAEIRGAVPGLAVTPKAAYISLGAPARVRRRHAALDASCGSASIWATGPSICSCRSPACGGRAPPSRTCWC